jgi:hypothetical protein
MGARKGAYRVLVGRLYGKRPLRRLKYRWEDNFKTDLQEVGLGVNWIDLAQDSERWRTLVNLRVP